MSSIRPSFHENQSPAPVEQPQPVIFRWVVVVDSRYLLPRVAVCAQIVRGQKKFLLRLC